MKLTPKQIDGLIQAIGKTREQEYTCSECLDHVSEFAEYQLRGQAPPAAMAAVQHHLELCPECREEYDVLLTLLSQLDPDAPDDDAPPQG